MQAKCTSLSSLKGRCIVSCLLEMKPRWLTCVPCEPLDGPDILQLLPSVAAALERGRNGVLLELGLQVLETELHCSHALSLHSQLR